MNTNQVTGSMSAMRARAWTDEWSRRAVDIIPEHILFEHNSRIFAFLAWNLDGQVDARRMQEYIDDAATKNLKFARASIETLQWAFCMLGKNNPAARLKIHHRRQRRELVAATERQYRAVLRVFGQNGNDPESMLLVMLMWHCGLAFVDACTLTWEAIDMDALIIKDTRSKTGCRFRIPFARGGELHTTLLEVGSSGPRVGPVSSRYDIQYRNGNSRLTARIQSACRLAGLPPGSSTHAFRRGFITRLAQAGMDVMTLAEMSGHVDTASLKSYYKPTDDHLRKAMSKARKNDTPRKAPRRHAKDGEVDRPQTEGQAAAADSRGDCPGIGAAQAHGGLAVIKGLVG